MKKAGIVILNYNNWEDTIGCINSVLDINYKNISLFIIDNNSPNDSYQQLDEYVKKMYDQTLKNGNEIEINVTKSEVNGGYAAGNNIGIKQALDNNCDYILILNNDVVVAKDFLNILIDFAEPKSDVYLCGPKIIDTLSGAEYGARRFYNNSDYWFVSPNIIWHFFNNNKRYKYIRFEDEKPFTKPFQIDVLSGSCMLFKAGYFKEAGLLDEHTFLYMEELIIGHTAQKLGYKTYCIPQAVIYHEGGKSTSTLKKSFIVKQSINSFKYYMRAYQKYSKLKTAILLSGFYMFLWLLKFKQLIKFNKTQ